MIQDRGTDVYIQVNHVWTHDWFHDMLNRQLCFKWPLVQKNKRIDMSFFLHLEYSSEQRIQNWENRGMMHSTVRGSTEWTDVDTKINLWEPGDGNVKHLLRDGGGRWSNKAEWSGGGELRHVEYLVIAPPVLHSPFSRSPKERTITEFLRSSTLR